MHTCRRWRSHTRRSPRRTSTSTHRQPEPDGLPSRRRHDLMKPLHLIALLAALMGPGCATALPASVPEVAHATSPAPGIISAGRLVPADIERLREAGIRSEEHTSELQSLMRTSNAVFCFKKTKITKERRPSQ